MFDNCCSKRLVELVFGIKARSKSLKGIVHLRFVLFKLSVDLILKIFDVLPHFGKYAL